MTKPIHRIFNGDTGEILEREYTDDEMQQQLSDNAFAEQYQAEVKTKEAAKQAVLDKLGLSADEVAALLG